MNKLNWSLIVGLSMFGLVMALGTVFFIPSSVEPFAWLAIFIVCAVVIAKNVSSKHFLTGFLVSLANCVWITSAHMALAERYLAGHAQEAAQYASGPMAGLGVRTAMAITGPVIGVISGLVLGLFAFIASRFLRPAVAAAPTSKP